MATPGMVPMISADGRDQRWVNPSDVDAAKQDGYQIGQFVQKGKDTRLIQTTDLGFALRDKYVPITTRQYLSSKVGFDANALPSGMSVDASGNLQPGAQTIPLRLAPEDAEAERLANQPAFTSVSGVPVPTGTTNAVNAQANMIAAKQAPFIAAGEGAGLIGDAAKLPLLARMLLQGAGQAGASAITGGNATQNAIAGATGAASEISVPLLKSLALRRMTQAMKPAGMADKAIAQQVAPELLNQRQVFASADQLASRAAAKSSEAGQSLSDAVASLPPNTRDAVQPVLDKLNSIVDATRYSTGAPAQPEVAQRASDLASEIANLSQNGAARTEDLLKLKRALDEGQPGTSFIPSMTGEKVLTPVGNLEKAAADSIRGIVNDNHPDIAEANKAIHFWKRVQDVAGGTATRDIGKYVAPTGLATVAGIAGYAHGGPKEGAEWAAATAGALTLMRSPAWLSTSAVARNELANALAGGNAQRVAAVVNGIQAGKR